jgi:hypothetical protein
MSSPLADLRDEEQAVKRRKNDIRKIKVTLMRLLV